MEENNSKRRVRSWNIVINKKAECYDKLEESLSSVIGSKDNYAYICHNKDINKETGEVTEDHIHLLVVFENARSFNSIHKTFEGAHIKPTLSISASANYLIHNDKPDKHQYDIKEVITNDSDWYTNLITKPKEFYVEDKLPYYVLVEGTNTYLKACLRFGASQLPYTTSNKIKQIKADFLEMLNKEQEITIRELKDQYETEIDKETEENF